MSSQDRLARRKYNNSNHHPLIVSLFSLSLSPSLFAANYYGMIDQLVASRGRIFFGCWWSTVSDSYNLIFLCFVKFDVLYIIIVVLFSQYCCVAIQNTPVYRIHQPDARISFYQRYGPRIQEWGTTENFLLHN